MSVVSSESISPLNNPGLMLWDRLVAWRDCPAPVTIESILSAAEIGQLDEHLTPHYSIYYHEDWKEKLRLCRDLVVAGLLNAEFDEDFDNSPIFLKDGARITVAGRERLAALRQAHFWRRFRAWAILLVSSVVSALAIHFVRSIIDSYSG